MQLKSCPGTTSSGCSRRERYFYFKISSLLLFLFLFFSNSNSSLGQSLWFGEGNTNSRVDIDEDLCQHCETFITGVMNCDVCGGLSFAPDGLLYGFGYNPNTILVNSIYQIDINGTACSLVFDAPAGLPSMQGMVAMGNGIFYSMSFMSDILYKWDVNAGTVNIVGNTGFVDYGEMCLSNGIMYYISRETTGPFYSSIIQLDYINPTNSFRKV